MQQGKKYVDDGEKNAKEGRDGKKERREFVLKLFSPFDIVSLYLVRLSYFYFSLYREQPVLDIFLRRVLARTSYLSMWKHPRDERGRKNIKEGRMENGRRMKGSGERKRERERREQGRRMTSIGRNRRAPACSNDQNT